MIRPRRRRSRRTTLLCLTSAFASGHAFAQEPPVAEDEPAVLEEQRAAEAEPPAAEAEQPVPEPSPENTADDGGSPPEDVAPPPEPLPALDDTALDEFEDEEIFEAVAEVEAPPREPTQRQLPAKQLAKMPGARGDAIRAVEVLPGVARAPLGSNPILRGAAGHESATFLDGVLIPQLYHFGGLTSVVHPALLEQVKLYPSNFSSRYGRVTGGVIEAQLRAPKSDALHGMIDLNLIDSSVLVEGPLAPGLSGAAAVRRSNIDLVFETLVPDDAFDVVAAPLYWDYQAVTEYRPSPEARLRLWAAGSRDELEFILSNPSQEDPALRGEVSGGIEAHTLNLAYEHRDGAFGQAYQLAVGTDDLKQHVGGFQAYFDGTRVSGRAEWDVQLGESVRWINGVDLEGQWIKGAYRGPPAPAQEGYLDQSDATLTEIVVDDAKMHLVSPAIYTETRWFPTSRWLVVPGVRLDFFADLDALTVNPRLGQRYSVTDSWTLKSGVGGYSQRPLYYEAIDTVGNPNLKPYHALHTSLGSEHRVSDALLVDVEGFYKYLYNRVVATEGGAPPHFVNDGTGRIYGLEAQARFTPNDAWMGQLSYTLSRSERRDRDDPWRLFDYDQTHVLNAALAVDLGAGWEAGARFRLISGNPVTPVIGAVYDTRADAYVPRYGEQNSERDPAFHQLDLRVDKRFPIGRGFLGGFVEILNAYNAENPEGYGYSYDYSQRTRATTQPFFPNLGIRGEL